MRRLQATFQGGDEQACFGFAAETHHMLIEPDLPRAVGVAV
jgi:hypothetical protein